MKGNSLNKINKPDEECSENSKDKISKDEHSMHPFYSSDFSHNNVEVFIEFFNKLGKDVCIVYDHTYDTCIKESPGTYIYNEEEPSIKLCVSSGRKLGDIISHEKVFSR
jgi:hypothetical protein